MNAAAALAAAGRLAATAAQTSLRPPKRSVPAASLFGGGPAAVPSAPVRPRGLRSLLLFCILGLACLAVIVAATSWLVVMRRQPPRRLDQQDTPGPGTDPAADPLDLEGARAAGRHAASPPQPGLAWPPE